MENKAHALVAGIFALVLIAAAVASVWWFGGKREATAEYLVATRQNVTGLNLQGQVRYRGMRVGRVESIDLDPADPRVILVRISVPQRFVLTRATVARLGYQGMTGIAHVLLEEGGSDSTPLVADRGVPPRIEMQPSFVQEISDAGAATVRQLQALLGNLNEVLNAENKARIGKTLKNVEAGSENMAETLAQLRVLLADPRLRQVGGVVANLEGASGDARTVLREAAILVPRLTALAERLEHMVGDAGGEGLAASAARLQELGREATLTARQLTHTLQMLEDAPQSMIYGPPPVPPGPGEPGFVAPARVRP